MARKPRIHVPGGSYYVALPGRTDPALMPEDDDRSVMLDILRRATERYGASLHAYALTDQWAGLAVTVGETPVYKLVQSIVYRYKRRYRLRYGRSSALLRGRYHACLVEPSTTLPVVIAHIHTAPVRAGLAGRPESFPWSGHRVLLGLDSGPLDVGGSLVPFGANREEARQRYREMTADPRVIADETCLTRRLGPARVLGSPEFERRMLQATPSSERPSLDGIVAAVCRAYHMTEADLRARRRFRKPAEARAVIGWLALATEAATLTAVAERFGRDLATLSIAVSRLGERSAESLRLARRLRDELLTRR